MYMLCDFSLDYGSNKIKTSATVDQIQLCRSNKNNRKNIVK